ncbi:MAG: hypothetical protein IIU86_03495 [Oscillospiraceae bacterium]|nr:hypothetical protein [Oscillospiraceae bacterium]
MRYLRLATILIFVVACAVFCWTIYGLSQRDTTAPQITDAVGELHLSVTEAADVLMKGLTASDNRDGDLTNRILVERISRFSQPGVCRVSYVVFDNSNNLCRYQRTVIYDDYVLPRLQLEKPLMYRMGEQISIMDRVRLYDCLDGDITYALKLESSNVPDNTAGVYEIELSATNNYGDSIYAKVPLNIGVYSADAPQIRLKQYLVYTKAGADFSPLAYVETVVDGTGTSIPVEQIKTITQVDLSTPGYGQICFEVTDQRGVTGITYLTVIVEEP